MSVTQCKLAYLPSFSYSAHARVRPGFRHLRQSWARTRSSAVVPEKSSRPSSPVPATFLIAAFCCVNSGQNRAVYAAPAGSRRGTTIPNSLHRKPLSRVPKLRSRRSLESILYANPNNSSRINHFQIFHSRNNPFVSDTLQKNPGISLQTKIQASGNTIFHVTQITFCAFPWRISEVTSWQ